MRHMKRIAASGAVLMTMLVAVITLPASPAAASPTCRVWFPIADNGYPVPAEVDWPYDGSNGVLRARDFWGEPNQARYRVCDWGGYQTIQNLVNYRYVAAEVEWTYNYYGTLRARTLESQLGTWERFHFTCYPPHPANAFPTLSYCIVWAEANHLYVAAEVGGSEADPYYGTLRARTQGANVGAWELFYHYPGEGPL